MSFVRVASKQPTMETTPTILTAITLWIFLPLMCSSLDPIVKYGRTTIIGESITFNYRKVNQYLGVPYAKPPIGPLRFKPTVPIDVNEETRIEAVTNPPACPQLSQYPFPWYDNSSRQDEDCLYLNIWAPDTIYRNTEAVMYWMYGGGFRFGSIAKEVYDGLALAAMADITVVTVNYRVGALGFYTDGTEEAPGNAGLWDVLEGLRWVNKNIRAFGGDPERLTIAGQSAGSILVGLLSISPLTKGLFARQIMESGSPAFRDFDDNTQNIRTGQELAELVGCATNGNTLKDNPSEITGCLKSIEIEELIKKESLINPRSSSDFLPQYGDKIMPSNPREALIKGNLHCTDLLIGNNADEGAHRITIANPELFGFFGEKDPQINKTFGKEMLRQNFSMPEDIIDFYLPDDLPEDDYDKVRLQTYTAVGDTSLLCPTMYHAYTCAKKNFIIFYYMWKHRPSTNPWAPWMGATHFSEVQFVFGKPLQYPEQYTKNESFIAEEMNYWWSNFVQYGIPSPYRGETESLWFHYKTISPLYNVIPRDYESRWEGIHPNGCNFLKPYFGFVD